jgi:hypothetical protein
MASDRYPSLASHDKGVQDAFWLQLLAQRNYVRAEAAEGRSTDFNGQLRSTTACDVCFQSWTVQQLWPACATFQFTSGLLRTFFLLYVQNVITPAVTSADSKECHSWKWRVPVCVA